MNILLCSDEGIVSMETSPESAAAKMVRQPALKPFLLDFVDGMPTVNHEVEFKLSAPEVVATVSKVELSADGEVIGTTQVKNAS